MAKFTVYTDKHNEFRWKFLGSNNCVIAKSGESYKKQEDCITSLNLLQKDIGGAAVDYQLRNGVHPLATVKAASAPGAVPAPTTAAHPAGTVHPAISAHPAVAAPAPVQAPPIPAAPAMSAEQFVTPKN